MLPLGPTPAEGDIWADFVDGAFLRLRSVDLGGAAFTPLQRDVAPFPISAVLSVGGGSLFYGGSVISTNEYELYSTQLTPEPSGRLLLASGALAALAAARRRRSA